MGLKTVFLLVVALVNFLAVEAWAKADLPSCLKRDQVMNLNNGQVLEWKRSSKNQFKDRGFVRGTLVQALLDRKSHVHLEIDLDGGDDDRQANLEVIYNKEFGRVPQFRRGSVVIACGDYITSNRDSGRYKASPVGAILHWVHMSPNLDRHEAGYLMIDGVLTGQVNPDDGGGGRNFIAQMWEGLFQFPQESWQ